MHRPSRWLIRLLAFVQLLLVLILIREWLYVTTYRLYAEDRIDPANHDGLVWQQFNIRDNNVVPQIFTEGTVRLKFAVQFARPTVLWVATDPSGLASYEIHLLEKGSRRLLVKHELRKHSLERVSLPPSSGILEITSHGSMTWSDLRIVDSPGSAPYLIVLAILLLLSFVLGRARAAGLPSGPSSPRQLRLFMGTAIVGSSVVMLIVVEAAMHLFGAPASILTMRRELGEVSQDPQWENSPAYGMRLRPNLDSTLAWQDGDIVRMGFIPPAGAGGRNRYPLHTDAEGFRNPRVREAIDVAALGDSFTDALTLPLDQIWTARLERSLGLPVQNYGTAGFGPQQELRVLSDYAIHHHPRIVLLAFFAGNDVFNAETFDNAEKAHGSLASPPTGWKIKKIVARYDTFYLFSLGQAVQNSLARLSLQISIHDAPAVQNADNNDDTDPTGEADPLSVPSFSRGRFTIPVNHRNLRFALMPPYLQTLTFSEARFERHPGWLLTRQTLLEMDRVSRSNGATFVVLFIPFKSQVHLPLLERSFSRRELEEAFRFYFRQQPVELDLKAMSANRLALNELMRRFCEEAHIPLIDLTAALQAQVGAGRNMYFPDDAHWNAAGHELAADAVADFLKQRGFDQTSELHGFSAEVKPEPARN